MDYNKVAKELVPLLGGKENVVSATHCATRLRLVIDDESKVDSSEIEELDGVKGAFSSSGQYQVIFGTGTVNKVYQPFAQELGIEAGETSSNQQSSSGADHKEAAKQNMNPLARFAKTLSNIFVPIIPAIVASGVLMGVLGLLNTYEVFTPESAIYVLLNMFSSAAFIILPILIGFSAAREFGGNSYLGAVIGGIMTHPELLNPWGLQGGASPETMEFIGMNVELLGYQGTVIPVLLTVYAMSKIERGVRKITPSAIDLLVTPFVTVIVTGFVALLVIGPLGRVVGNGVTFALDAVYGFGSGLAGLVFGGTYSLIVLTGVHHSFHAIEAELLNSGGNYLLPIWSMANVAQGGAGLAVFFKTKNKKTKELAIPAATSAFLGITEPVIFGVNMKYRRPFIAALIGGALGGFYVTMMGVEANGIGLTGAPMAAIATDVLNYVIGFAIAVGTAFIATFLLGWKEEK
ncbi:PTS sugar transporter [Pontibacillus halophilus JSM 076056 = DSM 19796]|uniref:PTS sugar transporter n=1 Tax=Pontibacillus halophilus JSM 076056 = DSM 19796 TaxID=1385510 RepID=A0A0A5GP74_9BACI|nr:sucrose-specific PTS transporter subunit IIBC [Pontibacillus halophilus]KGX93794.1 PTS sugar transporter [Pontibacillus halophilus JSM 076056 = DSM 19796]